MTNSNNDNSMTRICTLDLQQATGRERLAQAMRNTTASLPSATAERPRALPDTSVRLLEGTCPLNSCDGSGWYKNAVRFGHPDFGKLQPCECKQQQLLEQATQRSARVLSRLSAELGGKLANCRLDNYSLARAGFVDMGKWQCSSDDSKEYMQEALEACKHYVTAPRGWLYLYGPTGSGKTHLAAAVAHELAAKGVSASYASEPALMRYLREAYDRSGRSADELTADARMQALQNVELLILDDLGTAYRGKGDNWVDAQIFDLLEPREKHNRLTVITSNLELDALEPRVRSRIKGAQILPVINADQRGNA